MRHLLFLLLAITLLLTACNKTDNPELDQKSDETVTSLLFGTDEKEGDKNGDKENDCFELIFPISITMPDGTILSGDEKELVQAIKSWYNEHPDVNAKPQLIFPVDISWPDKDIIKTLENEDDLEKAKKYCESDKNDDEKDDCFDILLPYSLTMPDGTVIQINGESDVDPVKSWYEAHPDVKKEPTLIYPIQIAWPDKDIIVTINNEEELEQAKKDC